MLPYSPLHHLLAADAGRPLVLTSGNVSDEPIAYRDEDALARLAPIADAFLVHDRPIHMRTDDSVTRVVVVGPGRRRPLALRRSRGFVPRSMALPVPAGRHLLACGAELKAAFCVAREGRAWVSHHIGDLGGYETLRSYTEGVEHFERLFAVAPEVVAHDLHPDYASTRYALEREGVELVAVQHHHAHLAACLAEHGERGPAVGAIFDGAGLGTDGTVWGGELLTGDLQGFERAGHLWPARLPGGDRAAREPWRMACAWLLEAAGDAGPPPPGALAGRVEPDRWRAVARLARSGLAAPVTTSAGRLFDAVAALCGLRAETTYEGQAAVELEAACDPAERGRLSAAGARRRRAAAARRARDGARRRRRPRRRPAGADGGGALPQRDGGRHRGRLHGDRARARARDRCPLRRGVPEPEAARVDRGRARRRGPARARARAAAPERRRDRLRAGGDRRRTRLTPGSRENPASRGARVRAAPQRAKRQIPSKRVSQGSLSGSSNP